MTELHLNGRRVQVAAALDKPLLWVLRDELGLTGSKYGCGAGVCGACTVHLDGEAVRSCVLTVAEAAGRQVTSIEGLGGGRCHELQDAWVAENVPQCGYCQSGMLMAAAALLRHTPDPTDADIDVHIRNLCRCGTYPRVRKAIHRAARALKSRTL